MPLSKRNPWEDNAAALRTYPDHVLVDIARNDSAQHDYRKLAVEVLWVRKSPKIKHPELQHLVHELEIELDGIVFDHPAPSGGGPLFASVTTDTIFSQTVEGIPEAGQDSDRAGSTIEDQVHTGADVHDPVSEFTGFDQVQLMGPRITEMLRLSLPKITLEEPLVPTELQSPLPTESTHAEIPISRETGTENSKDEKPTNGN
jgi:hypothetical protein